MGNMNIIDAIGAKINYLSHKQEVISQNVANADTPGYAARDLTPVDFGALVGVKESSAGQMKMALTNTGHMGTGGARAGTAKVTLQKSTYEVAPAGNAVVLEEQLVNANKTRMEYDLMVNLYTKNMQLMKTALGTQR